MTMPLRYRIPSWFLPPGFHQSGFAYFPDSALFIITEAFPSFPCSFHPVVFGSEVSLEWQYFPEIFRHGFPIFVSGSFGHAAYRIPVILRSTVNERIQRALRGWTWVESWAVLHGLKGQCFIVCTPVAFIFPVYSICQDWRCLGNGIIHFSAFISWKEV